MRLLDANERVARGHAAEFAARLQQFGDRAKQELLKRAIAKTSKRVAQLNRQMRFCAIGMMDRHGYSGTPRSSPFESRVASRMGVHTIRTPYSVQVLVEDTAEYGTSPDPLWH